MDLEESLEWIQWKLWNGFSGRDIVDSVESLERNMHFVVIINIKIKSWPLLIPFFLCFLFCSQI